MHPRVWSELGWVFSELGWVFSVLGWVFRFSAMAGSCLCLSSPADFKTAAGRILLMMAAGNSKLVKLAKSFPLPSDFQSIWNIAGPCHREIRHPIKNRLSEIMAGRT